MTASSIQATVAATRNFHHVPRDPDRVTEIAGPAPDGHFLAADIARAGARAFGVKPDYFLGTRRLADLSRARHAVMWVAYHLTGRTLPALGRAFGGRDHTTVLHAVRATEIRLAAGDEATRTMVCETVRHLHAIVARVPIEVTQPVIAPPTPVAEVAAPPPAPARTGSGGCGREVGSREWFHDNDAAFRSGLYDAHPELFA